MIISIISNLVSGMTSGTDTFTFGFGAEYFANLDLDEAIFPVVYLDQPIPIDFEAHQSGFIAEEYPITLFFMYKSELDYTPTQHDVNCIQPARLAVRQFISVCQASELIDSIDVNGQALEFFNLLDVNVSGISIPLNIKPSINASVCIQ